MLIALFVVSVDRLVPEPAREPADSGACNAPGPAPVTTAPTIRSRLGRDPPAVRPARHRGGARRGRRPQRPRRQIVTALGAYADHESLAISSGESVDLLLSVFNASTVRGQAKAVTDELRAAGFESMLDSGNDPLYPASDLRCVAQIRFGPAGAAGRAHRLLVTPCAPAGRRFPD